MNLLVVFARKLGAKDKKPRLRNPKGGLTAAGRKYFKSKFNQNLRPGVKKTISKMSLDDMRRKGSWAARFYGRSKLPPLKDSMGRPTRFALSAAAWGEKVPSTNVEARAIATRGRKLLAMYKGRKNND